jgi:tetratricopeptide (TPR) repeat protein
MLTPRFPLSALLALLLASPAAGQVDGVSREEMWFAPTEEDWARPCLITWQRTWEDAQQVAKETGKPILICVNMDGEIASEHYAGVRYRQAEIAALYAPYVTVMASVYRHTPRDHDEEGGRIECPRFGGVTCGEHIAIEPVLFEQFFEGTRVAPRHIMVELEGGEQYDIYYAFDTQSVFATVVEGISTRAPAEPEINRGDRSLLERVASREIHDRAEVEAAYRAGDRVLRRRILESAASFREIPQTDLLRLALFGDDPELRRTALNVLLASPTPASIQLIGAVLDLPLDEADRAGLIAILVSLSESSVEARTLAAVHRGLGGASVAVDTDRWASALEYAAAHTGARDAAARLEGGEASAAVDPAALLTMAEGYLALAAHPGADADYSKLLFADAREAAIAAGDAGADGWRPAAVLALSNYYLGQREEAYALAEDAVGGLPEDADSWSAAAALGLFAEVRQRDIANAANTKQPWPPEWLADLNGAYDVLADHPFGTDLHASNQYEFLSALKAQREAERILERGLERFPDSQALHAHLRSQILFRRGVSGLNSLEATYEELLRAEDASPNLPWFAGYASLVAAEYTRRRGDDAEAVLAYDRGIAHFEDSVVNNPANGPSAAHYVALCLGAQARIAFEAGEDPRAVELILASFGRSPDAASSLDGLNLSTVDTAKMVRARLTESGDEGTLARLQAALDALDPKHLELPAYEGRGPTGRMRRGPMGRRRRWGD